MTEGLEAAKKLLSKEIEETQAQLRSLIQVVQASLGYAIEQLDDMNMNALHHTLPPDSMQTTYLQLKEQLRLFNKLQSLDDGE